MRLSHQYQFIYFSNPKTGSSTMRKLLKPYSEELQFSGFLGKTREHPFYMHISPAETQKIFKRLDWDFNSYTKFVFVRNPWARLVSLYEHVLWKTALKMDFAAWLYTLKPDGKGVSDDIDWQRWMKYGAYSIEHFIKDQNGNILVDKVIRLEDINTELLPFLRVLGLPRLKKAKVGHWNKRKNSKHYSDYYCNETRDYVAEKYRYDIVNYDYTFNPPIKRKYFFISDLFKVK